MMGTEIQKYDPARDALVFEELTGFRRCCDVWSGSWVAQMEEINTRLLRELGAPRDISGVRRGWGRSALERSFYPLWVLDRLRPSGGC